MTVRRGKSGTGITTKDRIVFENEDFEEFKKHNDRLNRQRRTEGDRVHQIEQRVQQILEDAGLPTASHEYLGEEYLNNKVRKPPSVQSPEWYAMKLLSVIGWMKGCIKRADINTALSHAIDIGLIWKEAEMKFQWEEEVLTRQSQREMRRKTAQKGANANRRDNEHKRWRDEDRKIQENRKAKGREPLKTKTDRARQVKKDLGLKEKDDTVTRRLD